jgi:hypothetical protein
LARQTGTKVGEVERALGPQDARLRLPRKADYLERLVWHAADKSLPK